MDNQELISEQGRQLFFSEVWNRCQDIFEVIPEGIPRLRLVVQTDTGRNLVTVPMEPCDAPFLQTVLAGVANLAAAKAAAAKVEKNRTV